MGFPEFEAVELGTFVRRRILWLVIPLLLGLAVAYITARLTPPVYQAKTSILVEDQKVPSSYVRSTVTSDIGQRLKSIRQQVTSSESIASLLEEADLYPDERDEGRSEDLIGKARKALSVRVLPGYVFEISFQGSDPDSVAFAANWIADRFIAENLKFREDHAANTTAFLEEEMEKTREELESREQALVDFRLKNDGLLPDQQQANFNAIEQLQTRLQFTTSEIEQADLGKSLLERDRTASLQRTLGTQPKKPSRRDELQSQLNSLKAKFTPNHPDVVRLQAELDQLNAQGRSVEVDDISGSLYPELDPQIATELEQIEATLDRLEGERGYVLEQISLYQRRIERSPQTAQELTSLTRDYDNILDSYESLLNKRIEARLAEDLERKQQSEQFRKLEKARPPIKPSAPSTPLYLIVGAFLGGVLGVALALVREKTDETLESEEAVKRAFPGVTYVISIPHLAVVQENPNSESGSATSMKTA